MPHFLAKIFASYSFSPIFCGSILHGNLIIHSSPLIFMCAFGLAPPLEPPNSYILSKFASASSFNTCCASSANSSKVYLKFSFSKALLGSQVSPPSPLFEVNQDSNSLIYDWNKKDSPLLNRTPKVRHFCRCSSLLYYLDSESRSRSWGPCSIKITRPQQGLKLCLSLSIQIRSTTDLKSSLGICP